MRTSTHTVRAKVACSQVVEETGTTANRNWPDPPPLSLLGLASEKCLVFL